MLSCTACRRCHYKCDGQLPRCGRCIRASRDCIRDTPRRFFHGSRSGDKSSFSATQTWVPTPENVRVEFVDVTEKVAIQDEDAGSNSPSYGEDENTPSPPIVSEVAWPVAHSPPSLSSILSSPPRLLNSPGDATASNTSQPEAAPTGLIYLDPPTWPLQDAEEATLLQHFINEVSLFFDFCDRDRTFATIVPQRVQTCGTLLSAVFALSARHLSRIGDFDPDVADALYNDCLRTLIPALNDDAAVFDETLLIIVVILRLLEEINVPIVGADHQGHLLGAQSLTRAQQNKGIDSSVRQAAYWACLRQEIYISLRDRRPVRLDLDLFRRFQAVQPGERYSHACAATIHCAESISFAYGKFPDLMHKTLVDANNVACQDKRAQPFYHRARGGDFPDIRYESEDLIISSQYVTLARIVLDMNDPYTSRSRHAYQRALGVIKDNVRQRVWTMCGVGMSNQTSPAALLIACMAISISADYFESQGDRERLRELLEFTENTRGWPTAPIAEQLQ